MQDNKTNRDKLYTFLTNKGVTGIGANRDEFETIFEDEEKQKKLYDFCVGKGYTGIGKDYDEFAGGFSVQQPANAYEGMKNLAADSVSAVAPIDTVLPTENRNQDIFAGRETMARYADSAQNLRKAEAAYHMNPTAENAEQLDSAAMDFANVETSRLNAEKEKRTKEELLAERKRLEDAKREAELRLRTRRGEIASPSGMYQMGMAPVTGNQAAEITDPEMTKLYAAVNSYDNAIRSVDRKLSGEEPGFWEGVADATVRNPGFYTMGLTDMSDARGMLNIAQNGVEGREDELLANALYSKNTEQQDEDFGFLYRAGNMFGHSVPFMVQTAVTGGFSGASRAGANLAGRLGKKAAEGTIKKKIINAMGTTIDDVIEAGLIANTAGAGGTWANIAERKAGKINIKDGDYVFENGESWLGALYKGEVSSILELYTEKLGGHFEGKLSLTKGLDKIGASRVSNVLLAAKNSDLYKGASTVMRQFGLNGYLPEVLEEEANLVLNSLLVGDNSLSELYNPKTQLDIFGGMLLTVGTMQAIPGTIATAGYVKNQYQMNRADSRAADVFGEDWGAIKEALDNATNEKVAGIVAENLRDNVNQNEALLDYYKRMMIMRGYNIGTVKNETAPEIEEAYTDGFSQEPTGANALNAMTGYDMARQEVARALGLAEGDDVDVFLNGRTAEDIAKGDTDVENAVKNYQQQKARMEGIQEKFQQTREQQYEESDRSIQANDNNGMVYATQLKDEPVYITGGNVALNEDGTIDVDNSSETLYVKFPDGHVEMTSPDKFTEVFTSDRTADLKAAKRAEIDAKWKAEFDTAEAQSVEQEKRDSGVVFNMTDAQGEHRIEILNEGEKMSDILLDGAQMEIPTEELNRWKQEAGIQSTENGVQSADAVVDNTTDNVAPTGDNVAPVAPVELPDVPDFFRLNGTNYEVASRNDDGSVDVMVNGKRETLPAGTDYSTLMPTDKKGEVQYEKIPVERTHEYFVQRVTNDKKRAEMIDNNRKKAEAERKKFDKEPDAGLDPDKWEEVNRKWEEGKKAAQAKVDYWKEVGKREAEITRSETREAVDNIKPDVMEETADEFIANQLAGIKITPESFKRETGLSNAEQAQLVGVISNDGVSVERAAEIILENYDSELAGMGFTGDVQDVRDVIISVLSQGNPRSYAKRGREAREAENMDQQRADAEAWAKGAFDMKLEELYLYEETVLPRIVREYEGFDENEYYSNLAENNEYDTTRESESIGRGGELLQGEQFVPAGGTPVVGQRNEGGAVSDDVQGGSQNGVAQEEVPVNEPVGNSEQLSSSEIPNNQPVAEGDASGEPYAKLNDIRSKGTSSEGGVSSISHTAEAAPAISLESRGDVVSNSTESSASEDRNSVSNSQENAQESGEIAENGGEIQETFFLEETLDNGDKKITGMNSRGEVATVTIERDGKVVSVDSYDEGVLFEHTEYDGNGKATAVTRYDKQGNVVGTQKYEDGKAKSPMQKLADRILDRTEEKRRIPLRERAKELEAQVGVKANIIESVDEVADPEARRRIVAGQNVAGWYSKGEVYLYMPNLQDRREIELTYVHEVVAHHGVKKLLGKRFNEFLDGVWNMMSEADRARMLAYVGANENPTLQDMRAAADEYVAELAEKMDLGELEQSTWEKIVDWFKELLENIGFENLTKEDIESMLKASYSNLKAESGKGKTGSTENDFRAKMTFHGSGAKFDRFDHAFMGTGEGAQAFGWGTYVTEVEGIGKQYANATSKPNLTYKGQEVDVEGYENPWRLINDLYEDTRGKLSEMRAKAERYEGLAEEDSLMKPVWKEVVKILKEARRGDLKASPRRVLYTVEIPDDNGSNYLHWEEVVPSNVVNAVKQRLFDELAKGDYKGAEKELKRELDDVFKYSDNEGYSLYGNISAYLGGGKAASRFLNEMGFVGISYPADGGRAGNKKNYVIFNENDAQIKDRTMFRKKDSERRQEKRRINDAIDTAAGFITVGGKKQATKNRLKKEAERKQLAKEMYSSVLKGDFNDVTLSQIDKFIEDATPANPFGRRISQRLPQRMERALRQGARTNAVDALFSRISESAVPANERFSEAGRREIEERKKELLKGWAIATGNWHTDLKEFTDDNEPIGEGKDSKVYSSKDGRYVIKASKGKPYGKRFRPDIDNIALFNDVFRDTRYEILGYGEIDGEFVRILQQPIVDFAQSTPLTSEERREYMQSLGFEPLNDANTAFADGEIVIADLQKGNVVRDAAGNISVIDADAKLHTKDVGGDYTYPPVEEDLPEDSGTRFRITPEMDAEYMAAVENGDMETAERLVKEAAKMAMPDTKIVDENGYPTVVYHRTPNEFTIFDPKKIGESTDAGAFGSGFYLSPADFGPLYGKNLMPLFVNLKNPLMLNDANAFETKEPFYGEDYLWGKEQAENLNAWVKENGYDGVWYENNGRDEIVAFEPNQIKSADAVTYDDKGNVIPLSERFNEEKEDIRFRITDTDRQALEFKRQHKGSANIVAIDTDALVAELLAQGFTADEIPKIRKMHEKGVLGFYDRKRNTIYLLGKDHGEKENNATFWHENTHKAIGELDVPQEVMDEFYAMPSERFIDFFEKKAEEFYEPEEYAEELIAYFVEDVQSNGNYDNVTKALGTSAENMERLKEIVEPIINYINHGRRTNEGTEGNNRTVVRETIGNGDVETLSEGARTEAEGAGTGETRFRTVEDVIEQQQENEVSLANEAVTSLGEKLNTPVKIMDNLDSVPENRRKWKGWFDPKTGEVVVVMPNHVSTEDAVQTVLHEVVGHKGLRAVLGEDFDVFLDGVYKNASPKVKRGINDRFLNALRNGPALTVREATEEYIAELAERDFEGHKDTWNAIRQWFRNFFRNFMNMEITDGELRYLLWKNYNRMKSGPVEAILDRAMEANTGTGKVMARTAETYSAVDAYNKSVKGFKNKVKEGWYDEMRSLKKAQEAIEKELGREIMDSENVYLYANHIPSINKNKKEVFDNKYLRPFTSLLKQLYGKEVNGKKLDEKSLERYTNAKHGIERNREMSVKNALTEVQDGKKVFNEKAYKSWAQERDEVREKNLPWAEEQRELDKVAEKYGAKIRDYSGLTAIFDTDKKLRYKKIADAAYQYVADVEKALGDDVNKLWGLLKGMTDYSLNEAFESGMMSKSTYEHIKQMYRYYVPLRGFTEQTAEDFFDYVEGDHSPLNAVVKTAYGRKSEADNIFATILNMANSAIVQGSKNRLKQRLLNLAMRSQTGLLNVDNAWYAKNGDIFTPVEYPENANEYADFEERMKELEKNGEVVRHRPGLEIGRKVAQKWNKTQHAVRVKRNGREYVVWVNGEPAMANAINGLLREEIGGAIKTVNQFRSKMVTQYSPTFVFTNLLRDVQSASIIYAVRRGTTMFSKFKKNVASNATDMMDLYLKHKRGTLDVNNPKERYFKEFLENGGETGYTEMISIEEYEKKLKELTTGLNIKNGTQRAFEAVGGAVDFANRCIENLCRFSAYQTSREAGISILKSIEDAKEVSVNFNRKGSGAMGQKYAKALFMFLNPAVQSIAQRILLTKKYPKKMTAVWAGEFILGAAMPVLYSIISAAFGDDDDEITGNYYNLSDYRRRSSLCLPLKDGVFHIPLSHESRVLFGLGELCTSVVMGHEKPEDAPIEALNTLAQSLPLNPVEGWMPGKNIIETAVYNFMPDAAKPVAEAVMNRDFAGNTIHNRTDFNEFMPEYMRGKRGTLGAYKKISKYLTSTDGYEKSFLNDTFGALLNPSVMEHLLEGYLGGLYTFGEKALKAGAWAFGNEEYAEFRNIPIASSFYTSLAKYEDKPTESRTRRDWENAFRFYKDEVKGYDDKEKTAKNGLKHGEEGADLVLEQMERNGEVLMVDIFNDGNDRLKKLYGASDAARKNRDFKRVEDIDQQIYAEKRNIVSQMEQLADDPMIGYTFRRNKIGGPYGERETYGDVRDEKIIDDMQKELKPYKDGYNGTEAYGRSFKRHLDLYKDLKDVEDYISDQKRYMKNYPGEADEYMNNIREKRAEAIKQINNYRKNL